MLPPSTTNYKVGGARVYYGGLDLGNVVSLEWDPTEIEVLEHFTSRSGARKVDKQVVTSKRQTFTVGWDEHALELYRLFSMGSNSPTEVYPLTSPLAENAFVIEYRTEDGVVWTFSHTKVTCRPSGSMDWGEFEDWAGAEMVFETLEDAAAAPATHGRFTFT